MSLIINSNSPCSSSSSPSRQSPSLAPLPAVVISPCAACKILRQRCVEKCVLAPYFPPTDPYKFTIAHRVFGASNIIKFLQELPEPRRADAVSSMVYEANARMRDPVYGSAGVISHLQKQVSELQTQLAKSCAELVNLQAQHAHLLAQPVLCMELSHSHHHHQNPLGGGLTSIDGLQQLLDDGNMNCFLDENFSSSSAWEQLWT